MPPAARLPFSLLPPAILRRINAHFPGLGAALVRTLPSLREDLLAAQLETPLREYAGEAFFASLINALAAAGFIALVGSLAKVDFLLPLLLVPPVLYLASFTTITTYPKILARKRARRLDAYIIPATRQLLIQVRSGVTLFNGIASLTYGYAELSTEFRKLVNRINAGVPEIEAFSEAARANPSLRFRRLMWQITNSLKVGGDVGLALDSLVYELTSDKINELKSYGQELSPWIMMYMLAGIILPSLGLTMMIVILSFLNVEVPKLALLGMLGFLAGFNLFFLDFVASRRPAV
jgi:flagellar protein FlaJ